MYLLPWRRLTRTKTYTLVFYGSVAWADIHLLGTSHSHMASVVGIVAWAVSLTQLEVENVYGAVRRKSLLALVGRERLYSIPKSPFRFGPLCDCGPISTLSLAP